MKVKSQVISVLRSGYAISCHKRSRLSLFIVAVCVGLVHELSINHSALADFEDSPAASSSSQSGDAATAPSATPAPVVETPRPVTTATPAASNKDSNSHSSNVVRPAQGKSSTNNKSNSGTSSSNQNAEEGFNHNSSAPVNYSAQSLEGSLTQGRILLKGDVQIEQADAVMKSDVAEIFSSKGSSSPQRALAKGRVSLNKAATATAAELRAVANELEYFIGNRKVILKGKPKIWRGRELLQGDVIEVFLDTNEIKVRGARGVMEPASTGGSSSGNSSASGVQNTPVKKSSQSGRR
jgi:lipopolysaccharide export system protein LptA